MIDHSNLVRDEAKMEQAFLRLFKSETIDDEIYGPDSQFRHDEKGVFEDKIEHSVSLFYWIIIGLMIAIAFCALYFAYTATRAQN